MTAQEMFDTVVAHLRAQGSRALGPDGKCVYQAPDGKRCAVGCLVENYVPNIEGHGVNWLMFGGFLETSNADLLMSLQCIHDLAPPAEWELAFERTATRYGLTYVPRQA